MAVVLLLLLLLQTKGGGEGGEDHPIFPVPEPWDLEQPGEGGEEASCTVRSVGSECLYPQDFYEETNRVHNDTKTFYACRKWCHENHRREGGGKPSLCGELVYDFKYNTTIRIIFFKKNSSSLLFRSPPLQERQVQAPPGGPLQQDRRRRRRKRRRGQHPSPGRVLLLRDGPPLRAGGHPLPGAGRGHRHRGEDGGELRGRVRGAQLLGQGQRDRGAVRVVLLP